MLAKPVEEGQGKAKTDVVFLTAAMIVLDMSVLSSFGNLVANSSGMEQKKNGTTAERGREEERVENGGCDELLM